MNTGLLQANIFLLNRILPNIWWADLLDVAIISVLLYWVFVLFRQMKSSFVFLGLVILAAIYTLSNILHLALTLAIFRIFFSAIVIGLIVIFQKELRRFFEIIVYEVISLGSFNKQRATLLTPGCVDDIVHVAERLAQQKIGMLIVIQGRESLDYHLQGGFDLNGQISEPLLQSIFDPSTPGHDGAVIIIGDRVAKFAAHLPLSEDFQQIKQYGTRHSAALGIAEQSDGLSIIVSEEKGTVAVARDGKLRVIESGGVLRQEINRFVQEKLVARRVGFLEYNIQEKIFALLLALLLWYFIVYQGR